MKKLLYFIAILTCFTGLNAMEEDKAQGITLKTSDETVYYLDAAMVGKCQTLFNLMTDGLENDDSAIPLPETITSNNFEHIYQWLTIIKNGTDDKKNIEAIIQYTCDHDLRASSLQSLIDIVSYLDIQLPGLLVALNERKSMIKVILQDSILWILPEKLKSCNAFANVIEDESDDEIGLQEVTREVFESITDVSEKKQELNAPGNLIISENLIDQIIQADKLSNEEVLNKKINDLRVQIYCTLNQVISCSETELYMFDNLADSLTKNFQKIPVTVQYMIFEECFNVITKNKNIAKDLIKDNELTIQKKIEWMLLFIATVEGNNMFHVSPAIKLEYYKKLLSVKAFYALNAKWQTVLINALPVTIKEAMKHEFRCRKSTVNSQRGLVALCQESVIKQWKNDINSINYTTLDEVVANIEKVLNKLPQELAEELCGSLIEYLKNTVKFGPMFSRIIVDLNALKISKREIVFPLLFVIAFSHTNKKTKGSMDNIIELLNSKTYENFSETIKNIITSTNPEYFENISYVINTPAMLVEHPIIGDIVLGGIGGFSAGFFSQAFLKKMSNPNLLSQFGLGVARIACYYGCYKFALLPHSGSIMYHTDLRHELAGIQVGTTYAIRILSAMLGGYLGTVIGTML